MAETTRSIQHQSNNSASNIYCLIETRSWLQVRKAVNCDHNLAMPCQSALCKNCNCSHSPLLLACKLNPSLSVVKSLLKANPSAAFEVGCQEKLPLHLACEHGASPRVIRTILNANPKAVSMRDSLGMLPIHKVCRFYHDKSERVYAGDTLHKMMVQVLYDLLILEPITIQAEDYNGMCPIEHALDTELCMKVIRVLQRASMGIREQEECKDKVKMNLSFMFT